MSPRHLWLQEEAGSEGPGQAAAFGSSGLPWRLEITLSWTAFCLCHKYSMVSAASGKHRGEGGPGEAPDAAWETEGSWAGFPEEAVMR